MMAAVSSSTAAASAAGSSVGDERHARHERRERRRGSARPTSPTTNPSCGRGTRASNATILRARRLASRVPVAPRELQAGFDRFGAAVAEERRSSPDSAASRAATRPAADGSTDSTCAAASPPDRRARARAPDGHARATPRRCRRRSRDTAALVVEETHAFAAHEHHRACGDSLQHVLRFERLHSDQLRHDLGRTS